jgi:predicted small lipoprotein YifL
MSTSFKAVMALCLVAFVAACGGKEEVVYVEPQPVPAEPVYNKY